MTHFIAEKMLIFSHDDIYIDCVAMISPDGIIGTLHLNHLRLNLFVDYILGHYVHGLFIIIIRGNIGTICIPGHGGIRGLCIGYDGNSDISGYDELGLCVGGFYGVVSHDGNLEHCVGTDM